MDLSGSCSCFCLRSYRYKEFNNGIMWCIRCQEAHKFRAKCGWGFPRDYLPYPNCCTMALTATYVPPRQFFIPIVWQRQDVSPPLNTACDIPRVKKSIKGRELLSNVCVIEGAIVCRGGSADIVIYICVCVCVKADISQWGSQDVSWRRLGKPIRIIGFKNFLFRCKCHIQRDICYVWGCKIIKILWCENF